MQNDDTTIFSFGERADELMTALSAAGLHGMSAAQADLMVAQQRVHPPAPGEENPRLVSRYEVAA